MYLNLILYLFPALALAAPVVEDSYLNHELAEPFVERAAFPGQAALSGWNIFRRQGCPNLSLLCPSGVCCSYATGVTSCCGKTCCSDGYYCTGGTVSNPCCVAATSSTNTCGSVNTNPCSTPGYVPCTGANFCCPPSSLCYVDNFNVARCSTTAPSPSPTSTTSRSSTSTTTRTTTTSTTSSTTSSSTTTRFQSTPTPIDTDENTRPSPTPIPKDRGFWTPAAIGGVAGGGAAALIIVVIIICCCVKKCCVGGGGSGSRGWTGPWTPPEMQRLSDQQIATLVRYRDTTQEWQALYVNEGKRIEGATYIDRLAWLEDLATRAIHQRHYQLRNGGTQLLTHIFSGAASMFPFAKTIAGPWSTLQFTRYALRCFGMLEREDVNELRRKACSKAGYITNLQDFVNKLDKKAKEMGKPTWALKETAKELGKDEDVQAEVLDQLKDYLTTEIGAEAATAAIEEVVKFIPWFGHVYGACSGIDKSNTRTNKVMDFLKDEALSFHLQVFVVNAY